MYPQEEKHLDPQSSRAGSAPESGGSCGGDGSYLGTIYRPGGNHYSGCQWRKP